MPNDPKKSAEKRGPEPKRSNAQDAGEGSAHTPDEFDVMNPAKQKGKTGMDDHEKNDRSG